MVSRPHGGKLVNRVLEDYRRERLLDELPLYKGQMKVWDRIWRIVIVEGVGKESRQMK